MDEKHIVAIDLGTSKFALAIARVSGEDIQIVYYREVPSAGIRYSYIFNPTQVVSALKPAIETAEKELDIRITQAVVGMPRYSVRQETNQGSIKLNPDECITADDINYLKDMAQQEYPLDDPKEVLFGAVAQSFSTSEDFQLVEKDIIGMASDKIEGNFKIFIGNKRYLQNIDLVFNNMKIAVAGKYFNPDTTAKAVLTNAEMETGVALIDFGAGVTSVSVYSGGIMRHYAAIPFGGKSITNDIDTECKIFSETLAENIKLAHGICMPEKLQNMNEKILRINIGTTAQYKDLPVKYLSEVITCRVQEIMEAILYEIQKSGFADRLLSGVVLTGGGANLANCGNFITELSGYSVRIGYPKPMFSGGGCIGVHEAEAATVIGMILAAAKDSCGDCSVPEDGKTKTTVVVEEAGGSGNAPEGTEAGAETHSGTLFPDEKVPQETGRNRHHETPQPKKQRQAVSWKKKIQKAVDKFTGTLYNMNEEMNNEEI
ncbi:MAG: cell division protein FtsA [Bacteroidetes bacterium]|uniref:Cell division protein FtsA n=1 Tax=Candidatus Cryptobacteroides avicola TaxID=2840757 RepID=A0A940II97_9BACT|nr:cell division protein FtsA [Candidatus Cryptobacteroides avicola]